MPLASRAEKHPRGVRISDDGGKLFAGDLGHPLPLVVPVLGPRGEDVPPSRNTNDADPVVRVVRDVPPVAGEEIGTPTGDALQLLRELGYVD